MGWEKESFQNGGQLYVKLCLTVPPIGTICLVAKDDGAPKTEYRVCCEALKLDQVLTARVEAKAKDEALYLILDHLRSLRDCIRGHIST